MAIWDAAVIGGGPAGLGAALWLGRYRRSTVVFDSGEYRNRWVNESHGYLGADGVDPADLRDRSLADLKRYETVERREACVLAVAREADVFEVTRDDGVVEHARRIVFATGARDAYPEIVNFFDHFGRSVFTCPSCDGFEARDKPAVVFGWDDGIAQFSAHLLNWASAVTIVTNGARFEGDRGVVDEHPEIIVREDSATELVGEPGDLRGVRIASGEVIEARIAFIEIEQETANELAVALGCETNDEGCLVVSEKGLTSVDGVYAAGDLLPGPQLIQIAAASGAIAGLWCARSL